MSSGEIGRRLGARIRRRCDVPRISRSRLGVLARMIGQEDGMFTTKALLKFWIAVSVSAFMCSPPLHSWEHVFLVGRE